MKDPYDFNGVRVQRIPDPRGVRVAAKGKGKGGGSAGATTTPHQPVEYPNTLRSRSTARIIEVLSEGVIYGAASPSDLWWKNVFLDGTPIADAQGVYQFNILEGTVRNGYPDQQPIPGFTVSEAEFNVGVKVDQTAPVIRSNNTPISAIRYKLQIPALFLTEDDGDVIGVSVAYAFDIQVDGADWVNLVTEAIYGKTMSPYVRAVRVAVPWTYGTLQCRVVRLSPDHDLNTNNQLVWQSYTEIIDGQIAYDDTAVVSVTIDAEDFPNVPQRAYLIDGIMVQIPNNYNPRTRVYTGDWNGGFLTDWTNNPAWILYALLTNTRWGLGRDIDAGGVDKWSFYEAAKYNDEWLPAPGHGYEPRFVFNGIINTRQEAYTVLTAVASTMLAQLYYANGTIFLVQDRYQINPVRLFGPADVEAGLFDYAGADVKSRWTAVPVAWVNPEDTYNAAIELVQDPALVAQQGYREAPTQTAFGATSKSQAIRFGRWIIYTNQNETELVTFRVGLENADLKPGDLINISDPSRVGARLAGRLLDNTTPNEVTLDKMPHAIMGAASSWTLFVTHGSADDPRFPVTIGAYPVVAVVDETAGRLQISGKPAGGIAVGAMWLLSSGAAVPTAWRVASISDRGSGLYEVLATEYHVEKYAYVDYGVIIPEPPFSLFPTGLLQGPTNLTFREYIYLDGIGFPQFGIIVSWTASNDARVTRYQLEMSGPAGDYRRYSQIAGVAQDVPLMRQGEWFMSLVAFDNIGSKSLPVTMWFIPVGLTARPATPQNIFLAPNGALLTVNWIPTGELDVLFYWLKWSPVTDGSAAWERATTSIARVTVDTTQINTPTRAGTYMVKTIDSLGQESVDAAMAILLPQITEQVHVTDIEQQPTWSGDRGAYWHRNLSELWLPPPDTPEPIPPGIFPGDRGVTLNQTPTRVGVYLFASPLDLGMVCSNVSVVAIIQGYGTFLGTVMAKWVPLASQVPIASGANNTMSSWVPLAVAVPLAMGASAEWDGHIECRVAQADGVTFADWFPLKSTVITARVFQFRLIGALYDLLTTMRTVRAAVVLEIPLRNIGGHDVAMDGTGHLVVTYAIPFLATPTVQLTARQGLIAGGNIVLTESDAFHFKVEHRNAAGAAVPGGSVDYFVQGYGGHQ